MSAPSAEAIASRLAASTAAEREQGYVLCEQLCALGADQDAAASADTASRCVGPLCGVMMRDVAEVDPKEYQRAALVLHGLFSLDPIGIAGELGRTGATENMYTMWAAGSLPPQRSALGQALLKPPPDLTLQDVMVMCAANVPHGMIAPHGDFEQVYADYYTWDEMVGRIFETDFVLLNSPGESEERNIQLVSLILPLLKPTAHFPDAMLSGTHGFLAHCVVGRPAVAQRLLEEGGVEILVENLRRTTPTEWVTMAGYVQPGHGGMAFWATGCMTEALNASGYDLTARLLESGYIDACVDALRAVEQLGEDELLAHHNVVFALKSLAPINYGECLEQVQAKLRGATSALRCVIDRDIVSIGTWAWSTGLFGSIVAANLFGRAEEEEEGAFVFKQKDLDRLILYSQELLVPTTYGDIFSFGTDFSRGLLSACISDSNKQMLLNHEGFIPLLLQGLLLSDDGFRKDVDDNVKVSVQRDFAECLQQCAVFSAGLEALKQHAVAVVEALSALRTSARSAEAQMCAEATLIALDPEAHAATHQKKLAEHVMVSYSWTEQSIVKRIVYDLQRRKYLVWFDLEQMKGSVMDRMSEAVEGAAVVMYGVSKGYKESANCRLEAQYAVQQEKDMIPLILEQNYKANGWLGLILGTRMYYKFDPSAVATDTAFSEQMDAVTREVGLRGLRELIPESVPPFKAHAEAPVHAATPAPTPELEPAPEPASAAATSQQGRQVIHRSTASAPGTGGAMDVATFLDLVDRVQAKADAERRAMEAKADAERRATESIIEQFRAEQQIASLQRRLAALHALELLELDELCALEDIVEDSLDAANSSASGVDDRAFRMAAMSARTVVDATFSRQLRRKFLS